MFIFVRVDIDATRIAIKAMIVEIINIRNPDITDLFNFSQAGLIRMNR